MKPLSTRIHGYMDYSVAFLFMATPWILHFSEGGMETWIFVGLGVGTIFYSLITDYELGAIKALPMRVHLALDFLAGVLLAASPWIFGFADYIFLPHLFFGTFEIAVAALTKTNSPARTGSYTSHGTTSP